MASDGVNISGTLQALVEAETSTQNLEDIRVSNTTNLEDLETPDDESGCSTRGLAEQRLDLSYLEDLLWSVNIAKEAFEHWNGIEKSLKPISLRKLIDICNGNWRNVIWKNSEHLPKGLKKKVFYLRFAQQGWIVFQVAPQFVERRKRWEESIKVWLITTSYKHYIHIFRSISESYKQGMMANHKTFLRADWSRSSFLGQRVVVPRTYSQVLGSKKHSDEQGDDDDDDNYFPPASPAVANYSLQKFHSVSPHMLRSILENIPYSGVEFPLQPSPEEWDIITRQNPCPTLLLGRSGTGKTTCLVTRMWTTWLDAYVSKRPVRQVLITSSATLCTQIQRTFKRMQRPCFKQNDDYHLWCANNGRQLSSFDNLPVNFFPLFLTRWQYMVMLDGSCKQGDKFFQRNQKGDLLDENLPLVAGADGLDQASGLGWDTERWMQKQQLKKFFELSDGGFESFDDIEASEECINVEGQINPKLQEKTPQVSSINCPQKYVCISYDIFEGVLWSRITSQKDRNTFTAGQVYKEIISHIKGSQQAISSSLSSKRSIGALTETEYLALGRKSAPTFSQTQRIRVYSIFQQYQKRRLSAVLQQENKIHDIRVFDICDIVYHIYKRVSSYQGDVIDHLYRDEVQDFSMAELLLDVQIIRHPRGLFYCGDICQAIMRGVSFRFSDCQAMLYKELNKYQYRFTSVDTEKILVPTHDQTAPQQACETTDSVSSSSVPVNAPEIVELHINMRTHSGILNVAACVVDLMYDLFPSHLERAIQRESAHFSGPPPILVEDGNIRTVEQFFVSQTSSSQVALGANQVVLGRRLDGAPEFVDRLQGLYLTIPQSKGLEFNDVVLYNFFKDSPAGDMWRAILLYTDNSSTIRSPCIWDSSPPDSGFTRRIRKDFSEEVYVTLCEELKQLYVGLTRARNRLIIYDEDTGIAAPFYELVKRGRCQNGDEVVGLVQTSSTIQKLSPTQLLGDEKELWYQRGRQLMQRQNYKYAKASFGRANCKAWQIYASAWYLVEQEIEAGRKRGKSHIKSALKQAATWLVEAISTLKSSHEVVKQDVNIQTWMNQCLAALDNAGQTRQAIEQAYQWGLLFEAGILHQKVGNRNFSSIRASNC